MKPFERLTADDHEDIVAWYERGGRSMRDIARCIGRSMSAVRLILHMAGAKLKTHGEDSPGPLTSEAAMELRLNTLRVLAEVNRLRMLRGAYPLAVEDLELGSLRTGDLDIGIDRRGAEN